jgi:long-subunit fatty acid transport protein
MTVDQFLKEGFHEHKASAFKFVLSLVAAAIFLFAASAFNTSQHLKAQQTAESQAAVANHTKTIDEIQQAVSQLKASNQADHTTTIKYINCVLVGLTEAGAAGNALSVYQTCLANSQIPVGTTGN